MDDLPTKPSRRSREDKTTAVALDYASPPAQRAPRRRQSFGVKMMKAAAVGLPLASVGSWKPEGKFALSLGLIAWTGITLAWICHSARLRSPVGVDVTPPTLSDRLWRPVVIVLALLTLSLTIRIGSCPHQRYWAVGPFVSMTVTDPSGRPCNNGLKLKPLLFNLWMD